MTDKTMMLDYIPGALDRTAPDRIWLQIDTSSENDERDDLWRGTDGVTWHDESIGGLEIQYVRADIHAQMLEMVREVIDILRADGAPFGVASLADKLSAAIGDKND